ncbi:MAG: hypothetical protein Q8K32_32350 [Archangium sp.]|nr:hypothetical protein [Archangium sp.]
MLGDAQDQQEQARKAMEAERSRIAALNRFSRLFASKAQLANLEAATTKATRVLEVLAQHQDALAEMIEFTPNTVAEQKALLKQMRLEKKELQADKKERAADMKAIRQGHREAAADAGQFLGGIIYDRKLAASTRRALRTSREAQLGPHEGAQAATDRQIRTVERRILWLERFGLDDSG